MASFQGSRLERVHCITLQVSRSDFSVTSELADKPEKFVQCAEGGVQKVEVAEAERKNPSLTEGEAVAIVKLLVRLEEEMGRPQDFEWAMEAGMWGQWNLLPLIRPPLSKCPD